MLIAWLVGVRVRVEVSHGGVAVRQDEERLSTNFGGLYFALCRSSFDKLSGQQMCLTIAEGLRIPERDLTMPKASC